jgi:ubiquinone/menaquinone biosynthesis C-methylase UbiE/DNA-binding transcriptional ArsR family regulator
MIQWMQSLSDVTRTRLLRLVERNELTVVELCSILRLPQSTVSRHLKLLGDDGWVQSRRDGTSNLYRMRMTDLPQGQRRLWQLVREQSVDDSVCEKDDARLEQVLAERRSRSEAFFSSSVGQWDRLRTELFGQRLDAWVLGALLDERQVVGDLGCGTGSFAQVIAPWVKQVIGVDRSSAMLQMARKRLKDNERVDLRRGELTQLPIDDGELTAAVLILALPYVDDPETVFTETARVTASGGKIVVLDMQQHEHSEYKEDLGHIWLGFREEQISRWLTNSGWRQPRWASIPIDPDAKGPSLFLATAMKN